MNPNLISTVIRNLLKKVMMMIAIISALMIVSLFLFTKCTAVVNQAGIVRGGSQRAIKQELAGASSEKAVATVDSIILGLQKGSFKLGLIPIPFGGFQDSVSAVSEYWNNTVKPAMETYQESKDPAELLEVSETYFGLTNDMVSAAQNVVDAIAVILYAILVAFVFLTFIYLRRVLRVFNKRVTVPIHMLESSLDELANGHLSNEFVYEYDDEIGVLYSLLNKTREAISVYISDIDQNLGIMSSGDLVAQTQTEYSGDYIPIQENINNIRKTFCEEMKNIGDMADKVSATSGEVSKVSQSLAEGAVSQTESIQELQDKIQVAIEQNAETDIYVDKAMAASSRTIRSINDSQEQMNRAVGAMDDISKASEEIATILGALDEITSQTNLLSLNASIEAARAGALGKGFAVVAEEVRQLAEQSAGSTKGIQDLIRNSIETIKRGKEIVNTAAGSLDEITSNTEQMNQVINEINEHSKKQQEQMQQVNKLSTSVLDVVTDNSAVSEECAASSVELSSSSAYLKESVGKFQTG